MNVLLFFGGDTTESEISILTAKQIFDMNKSHNVLPILLRGGKMFLCKKFDILMCAQENLDPKNFVEVVVAAGCICEVKRKLKKIIHVDCAIIACHGGSGENGKLCAHLEMCGVRASTSGVLGLGVAMDKVVSKCIFERLGVDVVDGFWFLESEWKNDKNAIFYKASKIGFPLCVKPARQGSSVGITLVKSQKDLAEAIELALEFDDKILIEKGLVDFREINVSVVASHSKILVSEAEEPLRKSDILSFCDKYMGGSKCNKFGLKNIKTPVKMPILGTKNGKHKNLGMENSARKFPAELSDFERQKIENAARQVTGFLELVGVMRLDFLLCDGKVFLNEINSVPGSLAFYFWGEGGQEFFDTLVALCFDEKNKKHPPVAKILN